MIAFGFGFLINYHPEAQEYCPQPGWELLSVGTEACFI